MLMDKMALSLKSFRLLGDPARVRLLLLLEREELSVAELQEILSRDKVRSRRIYLS
jgi:DNA-binding transcriptional ArsR family regulator